MKYGIHRHHSDRASPARRESDSSAPPDRSALNAVAHRYDTCIRQAASCVSNFSIKIT